MTDDSVSQIDPQQAGDALIALIHEFLTNHDPDGVAETVAPDMRYFYASGAALFCSWLGEFAADLLLLDKEDKNNV